MSASGSQKTDTRQVLLEAATEVFLKRGFARATTKEIAQTAGWPRAPSTDTSMTNTPCSTRSSFRSPGKSWRSSHDSPSVPGGARCVTTWTSSYAWPVAWWSTPRR